MSRYRLAAPAREDSVEIWEFIADESDEARTADRAVDAIIERLVMLARNPRAGRLRDEIGPGVRISRLERTSSTTGWEAAAGSPLRVLHGSRDQAAAYDEAS